MRKLHTDSNVMLATLKHILLKNVLSKGYDQASFNMIYRSHKDEIRRIFESSSVEDAASYICEMIDYDSNLSDEQRHGWEYLKWQKNLKKN